MLLTVENTSMIGKPIRIFDAEGNPVEKAVMADTETGEVIILTHIVDPCPGVLVRRSERRPAPLRELVND